LILFWRSPATSSRANRKYMSSTVAVVLSSNW
jgi:hypothetical protein